METLFSNEKILISITNVNRLYIIILFDENPHNLVYQNRTNVNYGCFWYTTWHTEPSHLMWKSVLYLLIINMILSINGQPQIKPVIRS